MTGFTRVDKMKEAQYNISVFGRTQKALKARGARNPVYDWIYAD